MVKRPFPMVPFLRLTKGEARITFEWFLAQIPVRLKLLFDAVSTGEPSLVEKLDFSSQSLLPLGEWFIKHVHVRALTRQEMQNPRTISPRPLFSDDLEETVIPRNWLLADETVSLSFDIGIYIGKVFQNRFESVRWTYLTSKMHATYPNEPFLGGIFGQFYPFREVLSVAHYAHLAQADSGSLKQIYEKELTHVLPSVCPSLRDYTILIFPFANPYEGLSDAYVEQIESESLEEQIERRLSLFNGVVKERLWEFQHAIESEQPETAMKLDFTPDSLIVLEEWLKQHVHRRGAGREEIGMEEQRIKNLLASKYEQPTVEEFNLTAETISLCFDAGLYVAKMFQDKDPNVDWAFVDLHRLILQGFTKPRNPFDLVLSFATDENRNRAKSGYLKTMNERWVADLRSAR